MARKITKESLWELRQEIILNSLYTADFDNSLGYSAKSVQDFFDGYMEELSEISETMGNGGDIEDTFAYDCKDNLWDWFDMFEDFPFAQE